jgi:hypothetical protein
VTFLSTNEDYFRDFLVESADGTWEDYIHRMAKDKEWGDHLTMQVFQTNKLLQGFGTQECVCAEHLCL